MTNNCIFFWKTDEPYGFLSNWYPCILQRWNYTLHSSEQYFMAEKAAFFHDDEIYSEILKTDSPHKCKELGRMVRGFNSERWDTEKVTAMMTANRCKYMGNPDLMKKLLATGDALLVEASPYDGIWGIKLSAEEAAKLPPEEWPGLNLLGKVLMALREEFRLHR